MFNGALNLREHVGAPLVDLQLRKSDRRAIAFLFVARVQASPQLRALEAVQGHLIARPSRQLALPENSAVFCDECFFHPDERVHCRGRLVLFSRTSRQRSSGRMTRIDVDFRHHYRLAPQNFLIANDRTGQHRWHTGMVPLRTTTPGCTLKSLESREHKLRCKRAKMSSTFLMKVLISSSLSLQCFSHPVEACIGQAVVPTTVPIWSFGEEILPPFLRGTMSNVATTLSSGHLCRDAHVHCWEHHQSS